MNILEKETILRINKALPSSYYKEWIRYFENVLKLTRDKRYRSNGTQLLSMQLKLAETETMLWKNLKEGRDRAKALKKLKLDRELTMKEVALLENYENHIFINEQLIRISRTICDGIAWRNLRYNRTFLSSSSRGFGAGPVDINSYGFKGEFKWACRILEHFNSVVVLNDLTRFLRVGDITEINSGEVFIHEIKKSGADVKNIFTLSKLKRNDKISDQFRRLLELQGIALTGEALINGIGVRTEKLNTVLETNFGKLKRLMKRSEKELVVLDQIEPCITLRITNFNAILLDEDKTEFETLKSRLVLTPTKGMFLSHSNFDTFYSDEKGNFVRSSAPYSVFPLSAKQCLMLMSGYYLVECILDVEKLKEVLQLNNWFVETITEEELEQQLNAYKSIERTIFSVKNSLYKSSLGEFGLLRINRGAFSFDLTPNFYSRLTMEFMSLKTFLSMLEEMYETTAKKQKSDAYFCVFSNELQIWN